jgi:hypothetical protein
LADPGADPWLVGTLLQEYAATLTRQERKCLHYLCAGQDPAAPCPFSDANLWKLTQRLLRKFRAFTCGKS